MATMSQMVHLKSWVDLELDKNANVSFSYISNLEGFTGKGLHLNSIRQLYQQW